MLITKPTVLSNGLLLGVGKRAFTDRLRKLPSGLGGIETSTRSSDWVARPRVRGEISRSVFLLPDLAPIIDQESDINTTRWEARSTWPDRRPMAFQDLTDFSVSANLPSTWPKIVRDPAHFERSLRAVVRSVFRADDLDLYNHPDILFLMNSYDPARVGHIASIADRFLAHGTRTISAPECPSPRETAIHLGMACELAQDALEIIVRNNR